MDDIKQKIERANAETVRRINEADPVLVDIAPAGEVIPGLKDRMVLHSGPPVDWPRMSGAQRGSMLGTAATTTVRLFCSASANSTARQASSSIVAPAGGRPVLI